MVSLAQPVLCGSFVFWNTVKILEWFHCEFTVEATMCLK